MMEYGALRAHLTKLAQRVESMPGPTKLRPIQPAKFIEIVFTVEERNMGLCEMSHDEVRALAVGDKLHLVWFRDNEKKDKQFDEVVTVDDVSDMDICCITSAGTYISIMLHSPDGNRAPWLLDKAAGSGWFEFYKAE